MCRALGQCRGSSAGERSGQGLTLSKPDGPEHPGLRGSDREAGLGWELVEPWKCLVVNYS